MRTTSPCAAVVVTAGLAVAVCLAMANPANATIPYSGAGGPFPGFGPVPQPPLGVGGKEYSHDRDHEVLFPGPPNTAIDPEQIVAWDGTPGASGVANVTDYSGTRPTFPDDLDIDAIANHGDFAYNELKADTAHLVFSFDDFFTAYAPYPATVPALLPSAGPIVLSNGNVVGGSGELSVELCTAGVCLGNPLDTQTLWASQLDINGMPDAPDLTDIDGVELWGPEPPLADADKYSLDVDAATATPAAVAVSVWNGSGSPYIFQSSIIAAVSSILPGPTPPMGDLMELVNVDALMVQDVIGDPDRFDEDPAGGAHDEIIFSIRQIVNPADPDGYYATGSELFVLDAAGGVSYLSHGGHPWDHLYALTTFNPPGAVFPPMQGLNFAVFDINAIEAIGEFAVPEPTSAMLLMLAGALASVCRRRA